MAVIWLLLRPLGAGEPALSNITACKRLQIIQGAHKRTLREGGAMFAAVPVFSNSTLPISMLRMPECNPPVPTPPAE